MDELNHVDKHHFDQNLANIGPCNPAGHAYFPYDKTLYLLNLCLTHGFQWDIKTIGEEDEVEGLPELWPTGGTKTMVILGWKCFST